MTVLARATARPPRRRRGLRALSTLLIVTGTLLIADAGLTLLWQEPLSALYTKLQQGALEDRLRELERAPLAAVDRRALDRLSDPRRRLAFAARAFERGLRPGDPIGRLRAPDAGIGDVVVQGTGGGELRKGPGHYPATPLPGERGTVAVAGHRTTYGAPFRRLDRLRRGDQLELTTPYGVFTYEVERSRIVAPTATWVTDRVGHDRLILSACHPLYSAAQRIVVFARLTRATARGTAR
jgi:sortase A